MKQPSQELIGGFLMQMSLIALLSVENTVCLDSRCQTTSLQIWNKMVDEIGAAEIKLQEKLKIRKVPLCIGLGATDFLRYIKQEIYFAVVFEDLISKNKDVDPTFKVEASKDKNGRSPKGYVKKISLSRITVPEKSMTNLRQWVHLTFDVDNLVAFILQPICSPLGVPCGDFKIHPDIRCNDCGAHEYHEDSYRVACLYRPRASLIHPSVWIFYSKTLRERVTVPVTSLHVNFFWVDTPCQEMTAVQFLIIAIKNIFSGSLDYEVSYSPVYSNQHQDGLEGHSYFYAPAVFNKETKCHGGEQTCSGCKKTEPIKLVAHTGVKLRYNQEYDNCIVATRTANLGNLECPPGPFKCGETHSQSHRDTLLSISLGCEECKTADEQREEMCNEALGAIRGGAAGRAGRSGEQISSINDTLERKYSLILYEDFLISAVLLRRSENRHHGATMIFAWFVLTFISIFISRFLKETAGVAIGGSCLGMGWWLWCHMLISFFSLGLIWMGTADVLFRPKLEPYHCENLISFISANDLNSSVEQATEVQTQCDHDHLTLVPHMHKTFGYVTILFANIEVLIGWVRPAGKTLRKCSINVHVYLGYFAVIIAAVAVAISRACYEIISITAIIFILNVLLFMIVTFLQMCIDRRNEITRAFIPVPEVKTYTGCGILKFVLTIFQIVSTFGLYFLVLSSYFWQRGDEDMNQENILFGKTYFIPSVSGCSSIGAIPIVGAVLCMNSDHFENCG